MTDKPKLIGHTRKSPLHAPDLEFLRAVDMVLEYFLSANGIKQWKLEKCLMDDKRVLDR